MNDYGQSPLIRSVGQLAASIAEVLRVQQFDPEAPERFWRQVAVALADTHEGETAGAIAKWLIADTYEREWDDEEFLDAATGLPGVAAYEEILDIANHPIEQGEDERSSADEVIAADEEEEAGSDALAELSGDILTTPVDLAIESLLSRVRRGQLVISPEWQRSYVWKSKRKKRFIESLLIKLPIPSILTWVEPRTKREMVIDGRQRLETLVRFCNTKDELDKLNIKDRPFKTFTSKEPLFAQGAPLADVANKRFDQFSQEWQDQLLSQTFRIIRFDKLSRGQLYQVFERYNTGGVQLQAQEIRNAVFQDAPLHKYLWNLAREYADPAPEPDGDVERIADDLRSRMDRKKERYGVYSFLGRIMAFTRFHHGRHTPRGFQAAYTATVASATNDFMEDFEDLAWENLRDPWVRMYDKTLEWYTNELALVRPMEGKVPFHAFLATVQLATTHHLLAHVEAGETTEGAVAQVIRNEWHDFALNEPEVNPSKPLGIAIEKQNSTLFWGAQRRWLDLVRQRLNLVAPQNPG